jgi:hypothetical protein
MLGNELQVRRGYVLRLRLEHVRNLAKLLVRVLDGEHVLGHLWPIVQRRLRSRVDLRRDRRRKRECLLLLGVNLQHHVHRVVLGELPDGIDVLASMFRPVPSRRFGQRQLLRSAVCTQPSEPAPAQLGHESATRGRRPRWRVMASRFAVSGATVCPSS